jgi:hypothetical protein
MTKAKPRSKFYKDTTISNTLLDELMNQLPAMLPKAGSLWARRGRQTAECGID